MGQGDVPGGGCRGKAKTGEGEMTEASRPKILRIGVIQGGKIIEEKLIRKRNSVTVGSGTRNTIVLPAADVPRAFTLFDMRGADYHLAFTDHMSGRVSVKEQAADRQSLKAQNLVRKTGDLYHLKLNEGSRGRVSVGECIILFQFVSPPPEPVRPQLPAVVKGYWSKNIDWPYTSVFSFVSITIGQKLGALSPLGEGISYFQLLHKSTPLNPAEWCR